MSEKAVSSSVVYKKIGELEISIDIYLSDNARSVPVLLWFHGGGLLQGHRNAVPPHLLRSVNRYKHALISADYRLAPQATIVEIIEDVKDCVAFIRNDLSKHIDNETVNISKLAVSGSSAGGYLAFLAGLYCEPKPNVILPIYPITDPLGYFFTNPQPYPLLRPAGAVDWNKEVTEKQIADFLDSKAKQVANCESKSKRSNFYFYMMAQANLAKLLGFNCDNKALFNAENDRYRIAKALSVRGLPPTYVVHGDLDRAVGVEQSDEVVGAMMGLGLQVQYERLAGKDHLFDVDASVDLPRMYEFMHRQIQDSRL